MHSPSERQTEVLIAAFVAVLTALFHTTAFPFAFAGGRILSVAETGYIFLAPLAIWLMKKRSLRATLLTAWPAFFISWLALLFWLRHVTFAGTVLLAAVVALFPLCWALAARLALPGLPHRPPLHRIVVIAALAGVWVILEWVRSWIFSGFPWLPLAASQWDRPAMLQILPWTGYLGLSWVICYFNLAIASYAVSILKPRRDIVWWRRFNPELYSALFMIMASALSVISMLRVREDSEILFQCGIVQPYTPASLKWDASMATDNLARLESLSTFAAAQEADVVFWPESATPWAVMGPDPAMREWCENLSERLSLPIVMGNVAEIPQESGKALNYNGVFIVQPDDGLVPKFYAKRKLVPFGEYNPASFITDKLIDIPFDFFTPGRDGMTGCLSLLDHGRYYKIGALLCYEDIFPQLARSEALDGADFFYVATNNAWYGEEAGAYQHAAHSVLRAVENRRPVLRCGNGGWSGLIDEFGAQRNVCERPDQGVYFQGEDVIPLLRHPSAASVTTFYTRHGDWVVWPALTLVLCGLVVLRREPPEESPAGGEDNEIDGPGAALSPERRKTRELLRQGKLRGKRRIGGLGQ